MNGQRIKTWTVLNEQIKLLRLKEKNLAILKQKEPKSREYMEANFALSIINNRLRILDGGDPERPEPIQIDEEESGEDEDG